MKEHIEKIKAKYDAFEKFLLQNGQLLAKDTGIGFWGVSHLDNLHELFQRLNLNDHKHLIDLGSGDGRVVLLASLFGIKATGVEFDDWLLNTSLDMKRKLNLPTSRNITFLKDDFMGMDLSSYDLIYISPDKPFHRGLERKLKKELTGKLVVQSYEFHPKNLNLERDWTINGQKFSIYTK